MSDETLFDDLGREFFRRLKKSLEGRDDHLKQSFKEVFVFSDLLILSLAETVLKQGMLTKPELKDLLESSHKASFEIIFKLLDLNTSANADNKNFN